MTHLESNTNNLEVPDDVVIVSGELLGDVASKDSSVTSIKIGSSVEGVESGILSWNSLTCINVENSSNLPV